MFVVIDTETTWTDEVMSIGAVIADNDTFQPITGKYYLIAPAFQQGGLFSCVLHMNGTPKEIIMKRGEMVEDLQYWLKKYHVDSIFAYNARFDKSHLPELNEFQWFDIMRLAAYRQYNSRISMEMECCKTGRLKHRYGVEAIYQLLSGNCNYKEKHNGWFDAIDELKIMEMLHQPLNAYAQSKIS